MRNETNKLNSNSLEELKAISGLLAERLKSEAAELDLRGVTPSQQLLDTVREFRERLTELSRSQATQNKTNQRTELEVEASLNQLERQIQLQEAHDRSITLLEDVLALVHCGEPGFAPLAQCQATARNLLRQFDTGDETTTESLIETIDIENHPLQCLITLVDAPPELTETERNQLRERCVNVLEPELLQAIQAGLILRSEQIVEKTASNPPLTPDCQRDPLTETRNFIESVPEPDLSDQQDNHEDVLSIFDDAGQSARKNKTSEPAESHLINAAQLAAASSGINRAQSIDLVLFRLISENRFGLAFHLAYCREQQEADIPPAVPSALIRALALSRVVRFPDGDVAQWLHGDFHSEALRVRDGDSAGQRESRGFFLRAAALLPALIAPTSGASTILHAFRISEELNQLYNFCSRVATYGDQLQGLNPVIFKQARHTVAVTRDAGELQSEIAEWFSNLSEEAVLYMPTKQIFLHAHWTVRSSTVQRSPETALRWTAWQQVLRRIHNLLSPVLKNDVAFQSFVKTEASRLGEQIKLLSMEQCLARRLDDSDQIVVPDARMEEAVRKAIGYARRWLGMEQTRAGTNAVFIPQAAEELRDEILSRRETVVEELIRYRDAHPQLDIQAGVSACLFAINQLHDLVDPMTPYIAEETDPRHVLSGELLKIAGLKLDGDWIPEAEPSTLENEILDLLAGDAIDWNTAFQVHNQLGDHVATQRLLDLTIWEDEAARQELQEQREQQIALCRQSAFDQINEIMDTISEATSLGLIDTHDQSSFAARIRQLKEKIPRTLDFPECRSQLSQIQDGIQRRRQSEVARMQQRLAELSSEAPVPTQATSPKPQLEVPTVNKPIPSVDSPKRESAAEMAADVQEESEWVMDILNSPKKKKIEPK